MQILLLLLVSGLSGIFAGMGMGGGTFLIPLLSIFFNVPQIICQSTNVVCFVVVAIICFAIYITLYSFALIGTSFGSFLGMLIGGNLVLRITYELLILIISICSNVSEINKKLKSSKETKGE